ncbi:hypothetical protein B0H63DRAFT_508809 [Podospora didyma]|uniref:Uncharacterized protein n=1 Tax=Podospora didyma TaxID=330526 RepID=A0AAE0U1A5_9PEZI|nr:hypothetical protein B0H63DRAFT_508809 [Podospora didyma]
MADNMRIPLPLIKDWARGTISLVPCQDGNIRFEYEHDFLDSNLDSDNFRQQRSHIDLFFTCLSMIAPNEIIKMHWLFRNLIPLLGGATIIWGSIRQPLVELRDLHGLKLLGSFVETVEKASANLNLELEECEKRALELEGECRQLAKDPVLPNSCSGALGVDSGKSSVEIGLPNQQNGQEIPCQQQRRRLQKKNQHFPYPYGTPGRHMPGREQQWLVKSGVISMLILSCPFAVAAAVLCEAAEGVPQYESSSHSTLSQMFVGFAGILAIIAPILNNWYLRARRRRRNSSSNKGIKTANPVLFCSLILYHV